MPTPGSAVLSRMLDRLLAGVMSGPNINCRPARSRQRVDWSQLSKLADVSPDDALASLLGPDARCKLVAKVRPPKKSDDPAAEADATPFSQQAAVLSKLRTIADDARTYETDTGVAALNVGFPLLSVPPAPAGPGQRPGRRILAPVAFVPVTLAVKAGAKPSVEIGCRHGAADRVRPNEALMAWVEQQTGIAPPPEAAADADPWDEVRMLVAHVAAAMHLPVPPEFAPPSPKTEDAAAPVPGPPSVDPVPPPKTSPIHLADSPVADDAEPAIVPAAVLGLYPAAHQGLIRDTRAMLDDPSMIGDGPIRPFLTANLDFDAPAAPHVDEPETPPAAPPLTAADADPFQSAAVALARDCPALVVHGPPGTGKSQTITNVIADHLAAGQRVLLVCEKRTALDVVLDRLNHLGLGDLCAIVHDPQRDQRDLYKSVKDQLDALASTRPDDAAAEKLGRVDQDLSAVHAELSGYFAGASGLHELVGTWLATGGDRPVTGAEAVPAVPVADLAAARPGLLDLFARAEAVDFSHNPWARCAGIHLPDYLARPAVEWRTIFDRLLSAAESADATASPTIPPFDESPAVTAQGAARAALADRFEAQWARVGSVADSVTADGAGALAAARTDVDLLRSNPIEPALATLPTTPEADIEPARAALTEYRRAAGKWTAPFAFGAKSAAAAVLKKFGLPLSVENAGRGLNYLSVVAAGYRARKAVVGTPGLRYADVPGLRAASDPALVCWFDAAVEWCRLLAQVGADPATASIAPLLSAGPDPLADGLRRSTARAEAIAALHDQVAASGLFSAEWADKLWADLRRGDAAGGTVAALSDGLDSLDGVLRVKAARSSLRPSLGAAVDALLVRKVSPADAAAAVDRSSVDAEIRRRLAADPSLVAVDARRVESLLDRYRRLQADRRVAVRDVILQTWVGRQRMRLLGDSGTRRNSTATAVSGRLITRGDHATRLREVIARGGDNDPLLDLRPVWMASPETVAQIFPMKPLFDVVVFDEASQCRLEEALPVLTRGRRVVIAGDPHQLPPTRFFESGLVQSDEAEPDTDQALFEQQQGQIEDLLAAGLNLSIRQCYLDVHYRSRHAELIRFSNEHFYRGRLRPMPAHPSRRPAVPPVLLVRVDGVYDKRRNSTEAAKVVEIVRTLLDRADPPSIGIACLNLPQRDLIAESLDAAAAADKEFGKALAAARGRRGSGSSDGLFVKNLENVQGDERDEIVISTTYGPDPAGKFHRRFGPLGTAGGGRRLNVLVTRARTRVHVVTSIPAAEYAGLPPVPQGSSPTGAWLLYAYLKFADDATTAHAEPPVVPSNTTSSSTLVRELAARLSASPADPAGGLGVDLAVPPDAGVLVDAAAPPPGVDRVEWDAFRAAVLATAGWSPTRLWSPHLFRDAAGQLARVSPAIPPVDAKPT